MEAHEVKSQIDCKKGTMLADLFNARYPIGTPVFYRSVWGESKGVRTKTRSKAWLLGHGEPVVLVEGISGGVCLWALGWSDGELDLSDGAVPTEDSPLVVVDEWEPRERDSEE